MNIFLPKQTRGFTLIEMIVAVALFSVVMIIAITALLGVVNADRKAQSLESLVDNLNFALDQVSRTVRTGYAYHCVDGGSNPQFDMGNPKVPSNCATNGATYMAFEPSTGNPANNDQVVYWYDPACSGYPGYSGGCIKRSIDAGVTFIPLTSPAISIDNMRFFVIGACSETASTCNPDTTQPRVSVTLTAHVTPTAGAIPTVLRMQTTLTQRLYDL